MSLVKCAVVVVLVAVWLAYYRDSGPFRKPSILTENIDDTYDYIVVGGGSAGSVVAARLSEDNNNKVLLLEAGGHDDQNIILRIPAGCRYLAHSKYDWDYYTEPQKYSSLGLNNRRSYWPRGRILGGSGAVNLMQYTRGSPFEYDEWARNGLDGWGYKDLLPYFLKSEDIRIDELKTSKYHSTGGPLAVSGGGVSPLADLYLKAGQELGYNVTDYNGVDQEGFSGIQLNTRNGIRSSPGVELLGPTAGRNNLHIAINSFVTKIEIDNKRAVGVSVIRNGRKIFIAAKKEVIVSAGAIMSPHLLMLSGIGPKEHLQELNIPVKADLPVGQNLQDHAMLMLLSKINYPYGLKDNMRHSLWIQLKYALFGTGEFSIAGADGSAFVHLDKSSRGKTYPDIQMIFISTVMDQTNNFCNYTDEIAKEYLADNPNENGFITAVGLTHPKSTGTIKLKSRDPFDYPIIDPQYLAVKQDLDDLVAGIRMWERFAQTETMKEIGVDVGQLHLSKCSEHKFRSDAYWECFVRHILITSYHPSCTCKMGTDGDPSAVVDTKLRVKGIEGLRVVDASILPNITSGNINAPTVMVAEKASDLIRGIDTVGEFRNRIAEF